MEMKPDYARLCLLALLCVSLTAGCRQREILYPLPFEGAKITINGLLYTDSVIRVSISRSAPVTSNPRQSRAIRNALVVLWKDGLTADTLTASQGEYYHSSKALKPMPGHRYALRVSAPGLPDAWTDAVVAPDLPDIQIRSFRDSAVTPRYNRSLPGGLMTFALQDDAAGQNYYTLRLSDPSGGGFDVWLTDPDLLQPQCAEAGLGGSGGFMFSDRCFNGLSRSLTLGLETFSTRKMDSVLVGMYQLTPSLFHYLNHPNYAGEETAFTENSPLPTNIHGGYGIWGIFSGVSQVKRFR